MLTALFTWHHAAVLVGALVLTFFLANALAVCIQNARFRRIEEKCQRLAATRGATIPVTIITGFLGSGKTSLLNRILREPGGRRICVIENEAGAVSIDHALLQQPSAAGGARPDGVLVMKNGCMCCSASGEGDELERTLDRLLQLVAPIPAVAATTTTEAAAAAAAAATGSTSASTSTSTAAPPPPFTHVVVETSGLADPAPIVQAFFRSDVAQRFAIDAVITGASPPGWMHACERARLPVCVLCAEGGRSVVRSCMGG